MHKQNDLSKNQQIIFDIIHNSSEPLHIGNNPHDASKYLKGNLDDIRISKGIARWTENFTPPTSTYAECNTVDYNTDGVIDKNDLIFKQSEILSSIKALNEELESVTQCLNSQLCQ